MLDTRVPRRILEVYGLRTEFPHAFQSQTQKPKSFDAGCSANSRQ